MKSLILKLIMLIMVSNTSSQNQDIDKISVGNAIVIINGNTIAGFTALKKVPSKEILKLDILREGKLDSLNLFFDENQKRGIIKAEINSVFESKTQNGLNRFFGLRGTNDIYVNGYLLKDKNHNILTESIKKIELIKADDFRLKTSVLNISIE